MNKMIAASIALLGLSSCATIIEGKNQTLSIDSNPACARCELSREGKVIATINCTPGGTLVERTKHDITVTCMKEGYVETKQVLESGTEGFVAGNLIAGGLIGWGVDSATGADNKYPETTIINMVKK
ncbi:MAG: translation initiation factor 2 [Alphaproteobacteria bacterium]|nr:MAG: translation initiation factor 2 [Alphaproteobacteria bacterium]